MKIQVKLVTEAIFGSGHSIPGSVDLEVVFDELGLPYMKAKTFKGNFRESMEKIVDILKNGDLGNEIFTEREDQDIVDRLMGKEDSGIDQWETIKFSDMGLSENIRHILRESIEDGRLEAEEIKEALTDVRSFTSIDDDGSSRVGSLRQMRVIKKDLVFEVEIHSEKDLSSIELGLLSMAARNLRHIGTMRTRGKGQVECSLIERQKGTYVDNTDKYIDDLIRGVKASG